MEQMQCDCSQTIFFLKLVIAILDIPSDILYINQLYF